MNEVEHSGQGKYESATLTIDEWKQVIEKAESSNGSDLHMYILRSWANQQVVTNASINAFREKVIDDAESRKTGANAIGHISRFVHSVTDNPKATCYSWNEIRGEWTIGGSQTTSLRIAMGHSGMPER
jgi:hypothetical protein